MFDIDSAVAVQRPLAVTFSVLALSLALPSTSHAAPTCAETQCPKGYRCEEQPEPCPPFDCAEGDRECAECQPSTRAECVTEPCESDRDCAEGMACVSFDAEECPTSPPCASGEACVQPESTCTKTTQTACAPKWKLGCQTAADCGAGFRCVASEECNCSGSSGGEDPNSEPPAQPTCECKPTGRSRCEPLLVECSSAADCASGWTCRDNPGGPCPSTPGSGDSACAPPEPTKLCMPPFYDLDPNIKGDSFTRTDAEGASSPPPAPPAQESSGCSLNPHPVPPGGRATWVTLLGSMLALAAWRRRRQAA